MPNNILTIRNLRVSFRTPNGKVHAVRGIDLDMRRGETLAIVGESGSGKSVTAKSMLGILARNALVEEGEIIYDGADLLKVGEKYMQKIRGEKIAMIFQDPLSSLNPIVKIGKQLTEAMIIKARARRKEARKSFNSLLGLVNKTADASDAESGFKGARSNTELCKMFDRIETLHVTLESAYDQAQDNAEYAKLKLDDLILQDEKKNLTPKTYKKSLKSIKQLLKLARNEFVIADTAKLDSLLTTLAGATHETASAPLAELNTLLKAAIKTVPPDFLYLAYARYNGADEHKDLPVKERNAVLREKLVQEFMSEFEAMLLRASSREFKRSAGEKQDVVNLITDESALMTELSKEVPNRGAVNKLLRALYREINESKNRFDTYKDSRVYSFRLAIENELDSFYENVKYNAKTLRKNGESADLIDTDAIRNTAIGICEKLRDLYTQEVADYESGKETGSEESRAVGIIDLLKADAQDYARKVTRNTAKLRAIKLMDEVGIGEPQKRYNQYPFEFSGGMRQRIVIAIALSADPEILICDEPTTALDVTIQSQILELINKLKEKRKMSVLFITHDLGVVANMADRVAVMYAGKIVESGTSEDVFYNPLHPYTWALLSSMPDLETTSELEAIPGTPPNMIHPPKGDAFAPRNKYALEIDFEEQPPLIQVSKTHSAATWLLHPDAPKVEPPAIVTERIDRMKKTADEKAGKAAEK